MGLEVSLRRIGSSKSRSRSASPDGNRTPMTAPVSRTASEKEDQIKFEKDGSFHTHDKNESVNICMIAGKDGEKPFFAVNFHPSPNMEKGTDAQFTNLIMISSLSATLAGGTAIETILPTDQGSYFQSASKGNIAFSVQDPDQLHKLIDDAVELGVIENDERTHKMKEAIDTSKGKMEQFKAEQEHIRKKEHRKNTGIMKQLSKKFKNLPIRSN